MNLAGVDMAERGRRMDEGLDAMLELWTSDLPAYSGRTVSFSGIDFSGIDAHPRPVRRGGPPIVLGGGGMPRARRRIIERAHGWYLVDTDLGATAAAMDPRGRDPRHHRSSSRAAVAVRSAWTHRPAVTVGPAPVDGVAGRCRLARRRMLACTAAQAATRTATTFRSLAMTAIDIVPAGNQLYEVEISDQDGTSRHEVSVADSFLDELDTDGVAAQDLIFAAVAFLTDREGHHELDDRIELSQVADRYEGFRDRIADLARQRTLHEARREDPSEASQPSGDERLLDEVRREQQAGEVSQPTEGR